MSLKSNIDWNEIIPRLPKAKRDDMYLEAVTLLSQEPSKGKIGRNGDWSRAHGKRVWSDAKVEGGMTDETRVYRINVGAKKTPHRGALGTVWAALAKIKGGEIDFTTLEKIAKNCKGGRSKKAQSGTAIAHQLWARGFLDVVR